ncbi:hypothetical protein IGI04_020267, partial [Brassica rapa subsp. trilocularis]
MELDTTTEYTIFPSHVNIQNNLVRPLRTVLHRPIHKPPEKKNYPITKSHKLKLDDHEEEEVDCSRPSPADPEKEAFNALARSFIRSGVNPNTIKTPSFTKLIRLLNPNFRPTVSILKNEVLEIHQECKEKAKSFLKSFQGKLTLSYEWIVLGHGWTRDSLKGPVLQEDFVCITAHFVDDDWKVRRWILGYAGEVDVVAMDDLYVHGFRKAVQGFEIEGKVSTLLLPNDEGFDEETLGGFRRGLMVHDVFRELSGKLLEDLRMIVGWGKCSSENWHLWVSNLQRAVDMKNEDEFSKDEIYDDYDKPSDEEWVKIETFSRLVGCMYKVAVELFEGGYSTSNKPICSVVTVDSKEEGENDDGGGEEEEDHDELQDGEEDYDEEQEGENEEDSDEGLGEGEEDCEDDEEEEYDEEEDGEEKYDSDSSEEAEREARKNREKKPDACKDFAFFQEFLKFEGSSPREFGESELDAYLKEPVMEWNKDFKAVDWWREEGHKYPVLSRVARDILSIPISRATSYHAYGMDRREPPAFVVSLEAEIHEDRKLKAKRFLNDFQGKLTLSYEWLLLNNQGYYRGPIKHEDFTCLTAHFIDDNWKVRKWILGYTTDASVPLNAVYIHHFRTAVQSFDIQNKVSTILLPNDEDFDEKTVDAIKKCVGEGGVNPPVFVVYCCADVFRLMVDGLCSGFRWTLYEELRMLVGWGRCSSPNWDLKLYHYQRAVDMHKEDAFSKDEIYDDYDKPSDEEWVKIETFCKLGGCVYKVAKELFEEGLFARYAASDIFKKPICSVDTVDHEVDEEDEDEDCVDDEEEADKEEKEKPDAYKDFVLFQEFLKFEGSSSREL